MTELNAPNFELVGFAPTILDSDDQATLNPITIYCGTPEDNLAFSACPVTGCINIAHTGNGGITTEFSLEEFGLIAALLVNTAEGN